MDRPTERSSTFDLDNFFAVHPKDVERARPAFEPLLNEFCEKTCLVNAEEVLRQAKTMDAQLWGYHDGERLRGVVATRIHATALGKLCSLWVCIGIDADELMGGFYAEIERWARSIGCYAMEIVGRPGWVRKLPGFKKKAVVLEKRLMEMN